MNNWQPQKLGNVANVKLSNIDKITKENERTIRLCNYTDIYKNSFINKDKSQSFMIASCNENEYERFILREGQVAITKDSETTNDIGVSAYISENFHDVVLGYHLSLITPNKDKLDGRFLHYWLNTKQSKRYFENNAGGSGQRCSLTLDCIKATPIYLPNLHTQKSIAKVLYNLEAKVELNNKLNRELETMAKMIYDYWFVQFDFPNEQGKPYKSSGGKMVFCKELKREIPDGWEVKHLDEVLTVLRGASPRPIDNYLSNEGLPWIKISDATKTDNRFIIETKQFIRTEGESGTRVLEPNELILSNSATPAIPRIIKLRSGIHDGWLLIKDFKFSLTKEFLFQYFVFERPRIINLGSGSIFKNLKTDYIKRLRIVLPPEHILRKINPLLYLISEKIFLISKQTQELNSLRDWLLPMLMNGQVTVGEVAEELDIAAEPQIKYNQN
jgi:type I restriction enzyme, S subunit